MSKAFITAPEEVFGGKETPMPVAAENVTPDSIYDFYMHQVLPAIWASIPILFSRIAGDSWRLLCLAGSKFIHFLLPAHWAETMEEQDWEWTTSAGANLRQLWEQAAATSSNTTIAEFMTRHFDTNGDGHISPSEMLNMTEFMERVYQMREASQQYPSSWYQWLSREWPMMDWKIGVFLWRMFGGILMTLCLLSIVPGRLHGISARLLRWPVLGITYFMILVELFVYTCIRMGIHVAELLIAKPKHRELRRKIASAKSYEEWYHYAQLLDKSQRRDRWQNQFQEDASSRYNWSFISELMKDMKSARAKNDSLLALAVLQQCTRKNVGGIMSEDLFSYTNTGEPMHVVKEFIDEVVTTIEWVADEALKLPLSDEDADDGREAYKQDYELKVRHEKDKIWKSLISMATSIFDGDSNHSENDRPNKRRADSKDSTSDSSSNGNDANLQRSLPSFHRKQVIDFFKRARHAHGRTALCLSGGGAMGSYHFGHIKGLLEAGVLPNIISGTSAGTLIGAAVCTRTDEELVRDFTSEILSTKLTCFSRGWSDRLRGLWKDGHMFATEDWLELAKWFTMGDTTFEEAYNKTGRLLCITVSATTKKAPPVLLNHLSAPNVTIASAIIASAAVPFFIPPVKLQHKLPDGRICENSRDQTYFDGSIDNDIPVNGLAEMLNCQFFVAAQCNPHVVPFFYSPKGSVGRPTRWSSGNHEHSWRGGFLLASLEMYLKNDMKAKFRFLNDLEAAVGFTSTMFHQDFHGSTTLVPQMEWIDYLKVFQNPTIDDIERCFQGGAVAAYEHVAMIKMHYRIADALDECLAALVSGKRQPNTNKDRPILRLNVRGDEANAASVAPMAQVSLEGSNHKSFESETLSTNSSKDEEDDVADATENWETIPGASK